MTINSDRYVPALLTTISSSYRAAQAITFRSRFDLGVLEWRILRTLHAIPDVSGRRVATIIGFDTAAVSRSVRMLEQRGLIAISRDESHVRRQLLALTPDGEVMYGHMAAISFARENHLLSSLTDAEREMLISLLQRMADHAPVVREWEPDASDDADD